MRALLFSLVLSLLLVPALASAQAAEDRVHLSEIVPALAGSDFGAIDLGAAPAPGTSRTIRRAEILAAITASGRSADGLAIPRQARIERRAITLTPDQVEARVRDAVESAVGPCQIDHLVVTSSATIGEGPLEVTATGPARPVDGAAIVMLDLRTGALATHLSARVDLTCPEAVVRSGSHVTVVVRSGGVRASASGVVRGEGRVGDVVHVRVDTTGALVEGRVVDASTVEIHP